MRAWYSKFLAEQSAKPLFDPADVERLRQQSLIKKYTERKRLTPEEETELQSLGIFKNESPADPGNSSSAPSPPSRLCVESLGFASNQAALTEKLAKHFGQRAGIIISENKVSEWLHGKGIPAGAPLPPTKIRGRFNVADWADWVERWIVVKDGASGQTELELGRLADLADAKRRISEERIKAIELENAEREHTDKWVLLEVAERTQAAVVRSIRTVVKFQNERGDVDALRDHCRAMNLTAEQTNTLCAWITQRAQARLDAIEEQIAALASAPTASHPVP